MQQTYKLCTYQESYPDHPWRTYVISLISEKESLHVHYVSTVYCSDLYHLLKDKVSFLLLFSLKNKWSSYICKRRNMCEKNRHDLAISLGMWHENCGMPWNLHIHRAAVAVAVIITFTTTLQSNISTSKFLSCGSALEVHLIMMQHPVHTNPYF
jgi:hypothetical protein